MKKFYLIPLLFVAMLTSCYKDEIENLKERLDAVESTQIASLQGQITAIKNTLPELENTDKVLGQYIESLENTAANLQKSINATNSKIGEVEAALKNEVSEAKTNVLAQLAELKADMEAELSVVNTTISALKLKDEELDKKIADLREYVDTELANNKDWANATFATLEQYSIVAGDIEAIKASILAMNDSIKSLEKRIEQTVVSEVAKALEPIKDEMVASVISEVVDSYMEAVNSAKNEITTAYTTAIATAISALENSMKLWVSDQLKGYYTIAETEGKLAALQNSVSDNDKVLQSEIDGLTESLATAKEETVAAYKKAIEEAINVNNGVVDGKIAIAIAEVNVRIENEIKAINTKIAAIESRLDKVEGDIATIGEQITNINNTIVNLQDAKAEIDGYIESLQNTAANLQESINSTNSKIDEVKAAFKEEVSEAKANVLAQLEALKADMEAELSTINATISALKLKDEELGQKIDDLRQYVDTELANNRDWANATFATLEQYASISSELATIKSQMAAITQNISTFESRINDKIENDIAVAISALNSSIQERVNAITDAYSSAISDAKDDITAAYTAEIQNAFAALEYKMKSWVSEQLQEYYTIQEVNGLLAVLRNEVTTGDSALLAEIEALEEALAKSKEELISVYSEIVKRAINENNGVIDEKIAGAIAQATARIDKEIKAILDSIESIENRLNEVEGDIADINGQVANIKNTIQRLQQAHDELESYVGYLQSVASNLQESVGAISDKIEEVETAMQGELSTAKAEVLAQLSSLKRDVEEELAQINEAIVILKIKDSELDNKITTLQSYVETELANNKDWANATFATLEQQSVLAGEVASIKAQIATINQSINDLESRINAKVSKDIANAVSTLDSTIQEKISEVTSAYTAAISKAKSDITAAYTAQIENAFSALEYTMKKWVNEQLAGYYTISEVDALLAAMQNEFNGQLASQKAYLERLISSLSNELTGQISTNSSLIASLRISVEEIKNTTAAGNATKIAENAAAIAKNAQSIIDNAAAISANKSNIEANAALIASNKAATEANYALIAQNKRAIEGLQATTNAAVTKCATDIAANAENIAKNAALIAQNATAINNNSQAIADNAADILQLQQDLADMKSEVIAAYKEAIKNAVNTLDGELRGEVASQVSTINSRINSEVETINSAIDALTTRVTALEGEVDAIQQQIVDIITDVANMKQNIADLMKRIQSVTYIPKHSDGKATVMDGIVEFDFQISPKDAVKDIAANWQSILSMKAVYTQTRAVSFVDMPILSFKADEVNGVITITASGENLSEEFFVGRQEASAALYVSDGNSSVTSNYINMLGWISDNIYIRDANFKAYLVKNFDSNKDNEISMQEALAITEINVESYDTPIASLSGIEHMTNLETLNCADNRITYLDLSTNNKLTKIKANDNLIEIILFSPSIVDVNVENNKIQTIDLSNCTLLNAARFNDNNLIGDIDISACSNLTNIYLFNNQLSNIYVWDSCINTNCSISYDYDSAFVRYKNEEIVSRFFIGQFIPIARGGVVVSITNEGSNATVMSVEQEILSWSSADVWCKNYGSGWEMYSPSYVRDMNAYESVKRALEYGAYQAVTVASYQVHDDYYGMTYGSSYLYWSSNTGYYGDRHYSYYYYLNNGVYTYKGFEYANTSELKVRACIKL